MPVEHDTFAQITRGENSESEHKRVTRVRAIQRTRLHPVGKTTNSEMSGKDVKKLCRIEGDAQRLLQRAVGKLILSVCGCLKIFKIAQAIADFNEPDGMKSE